MQVSVETTQGLQRRMTVQVPSERIDKEVESRLRSLGGRVRLDGFRPGKVPFKVVQKRYGEQVRGEVLSEILQNTYAEALNQQKLRPAGNPEIEPKQTDAGNDLEYVATFEILPEVEVKGVEEMKLERAKAEISDKDIDRVLDNLRKQHADYKAARRAAKEEDKVTIDFEGDIDGKPFEGNKGEDVPVLIGSGQMPAEFEDALKGVKKGDKKDIEYAFPEHFPDKEVAGKTAVFHVEVKAVEKPELPEVNDEFADKVGIKEGGAEALRGKIKESLEEQRDQVVQGQLKRQVMDKLVEANPLELPQVLVDGEVDYLRNQAKQRAQQAGQEEPEADSAQFEADARRRVTLGLLINEIIRKNNIKLDQNRLRAALQDIASGYDPSQQQAVIQYYMKNRKLMEGVEVAVLEDQVTDWVVEHAKVKDKSVSFETLMGSAAGADAASEE